MNLKKTLLVAAVLGLILPGCFLLKDKKSISPPIESTGPNPLKSFGEVITADFKTDSGFFNLHQLKGKYFLEIPDSLLGRDILHVARSLKEPANYRIGYAGAEHQNQVIRFNKDSVDKIFISFIEADPHLRKMNEGKGTTGFVIQARGITGQSSVIDITEFIASDQEMLGIKMVPFEKDKSHVIGMQAFSDHLELQTRNTYIKWGTLASYEINNSFVLLPAKPMKVRYADKRVGYFEAMHAAPDDPEGDRKSRVIHRFRLEPKPEDVERYLKGELVEPIKPIVFYIDPTTPKKWVKYFIKGVDEWQQAFEKAGFKNAICGREAPLDDKGWSLYDGRYNGIVYMPHPYSNAQGNRVHDPRTGEILQGRIDWFHNMIINLQEWYLIQAGPNDPRGRKMVLDDDLMGELIQKLCAHEVGHSLGLRHNFIASTSVPVDSLRSISYLQKNSIGASMMDYSRMNYVAQPEDKIPAELLTRHIGVYDEWAIEWGYRWFPDNRTAVQEKADLEKWVTDRLSKDKRLFYVSDFGFDPTDARVQIEDLGDNAMKASNYGMKNLKIVMRNLIDWTKMPGRDYSNLKRMTEGLFRQYSGYLGHVCNNIRLGTDTIRFEGDQGLILGYVPRSKKKEAMGFLKEHLFDTPTWLINAEIFKKTGLNGLTEVGKCQEKVLDKLINEKTADNLLNSNKKAPLKEQYTFDELLNDLNKVIFEELKTGKVITANRRFLQYAYVDKLMELKSTKELSTQIKNSIQKALLIFKDRESRIHLSSLIAKINSLPKKENQETAVGKPSAVIPNPEMERAASCCGGMHFFNPPVGNK